MSLCENDPIQEVSFSVAAEGAFLNYQWQVGLGTSGNYFDLEGEAAPVYSFTPDHYPDLGGERYNIVKNKKIRCVVSNQCGVDISEAGSLNIYRMPDISAKAEPTTINPGEYTTLSANGAEYYEWKNPTGTVISNQMAYTFSPDNSMGYSVQGISDYGCSSNILYLIVRVNLGASLELADGQIISYVKGGKLPYKYSWTGPDNETFGNVATITPTKNGEYTLTVTENNGDGGTLTASITINYLGSFDVNYIKSTTVLQEGLTDQNQLTTETSLISYQYFDGLGRPIQK
ncbi:MAG: hypothetical protein HC831_15080 [Chloroflexia bacterium]|nr:hypothetical protein [Chloroflexia bacterium]